MENDFNLDGFARWANLLVTNPRPFAARPVERLTSPQRLRAWLRAVDLDPGSAPTPDDLAAAIELRGTLRTLALSTTQGHTPPSKAVRTLTRFLQADDRPAAAVRGGRLIRVRPVDTRAALARIAREAADDLTGPQRASLRECAEHDCRWIFVDPTDRQRWCSPSCANRGRVRAHRARSTASARSSNPHS
jgi:predicted RNA-binding Zn ribbon-like protein